MSKSLRMMIYSQDSYGLGHLRRTTNLANALVARRKDLTILMVVDSPVAPFFDLSERIDFVKLPTVIKVDAGVFRSDKLSINYDLIKSMRSNIICDVFRQFRPHLMLVDHMPGGANNELLPTLQMARKEEYSAKFVLGLRDVIDDPEVTCDLWNREKVYDTLESFYDSVVIYSSMDFFPTAEKYQILSTDRKSVHYCGYVCNMNPVQETTKVRTRFGLGTKPIVTVMSGGGADGFRLMHAFIDSLEILGTSTSFTSMIVTGPFISPSHFANLQERSEKHDVQVHSSIKDTISQINATDVVVSMAGYNTLCEILRFGKPAVIVPRSGPSAEQTLRAGIFADRGLVYALHPKKLSAALLAEAILEKLKTPSPSSQFHCAPNLDGVKKVSNILLELME